MRAPVGIVLFALLVVACIAANTDRGSHDTRIRADPHQVSVTHRGQHSCSGFAIGDFYVLTAAHCVQESMNMYAVQTNNGNRYQDVTTYQVVDITKSDDVAVLRLSGRITDSLPNQRVQLADSSDGDFAGRRCFVTGWGSNVQLQKTIAAILPGDDCTEGDYSETTQLCIGGPSDGCNLDGGAPMVCGNTLVGVKTDSDCPGTFARVSYYNSWIMSTMA